MLVMMIGILASCSDGGDDELITPTPKPEEIKTEIIIDSEGDDAVGIGDSEGSGNVFIMDSSINLKMSCGNPRDICSGSGDVHIQNSTINSLVNNKRIEHNSN